MKKPAITITVEFDLEKEETITTLNVIAGEIKLRTVLAQIIPVFEKLAEIHNRYPDMTMADFKKEVES